VIKKLATKFDSKYTEKNVMISASHTHSSLSGFMSYYAYLAIESYGFNPLVFWSVVDGIVESISQADSSLTTGKVYVKKGELLNNRNRQSGPYELNPETEKEKYEHNTDKEMILLRFEDETGTPIGSFAWWPVHPISFNGGVNPLVSSDSMGYAALLFDYAMNNGSRAGVGKVVSGFGSSNLGDVSPTLNAKGDIPDLFDAEKCRLMGTIIFEKAMQIFHGEDNSEQLKGSITHAHQFVDMSNIEVNVKYYYYRI